MSGFYSVFTHRAQHNMSNQNSPLPAQAKKQSIMYNLEAEYSVPNSSYYTVWGYVLFVVVVFLLFCFFTLLEVPKALISAKSFSLKVSFSFSDMGYCLQICLEVEIIVISPPKRKKKTFFSSAH